MPLPLSVYSTFWFKFSMVSSASARRAFSFALPLSSSSILKIQHDDTICNPKSIKEQDDQLALFYADIQQLTQNTSSDSTLSFTNQKLQPVDSHKILFNSSTTTTVHHNLINASSNDNTAACFNKSTEKENEFLLSISDLDDISGIKCRAPFTTDWLGEQYHNAMISSIKESSHDNIHQVKVNVLFLNPAMDKMRPCSFFLDEKCRLV